ncbi:hypothetical protein PR001_g33356 [Phytophthora rubi]|uniref:Uncharacterized protein n=1 Tax=Phytophthora rubi TaxID=129364 RepID=A0A6A3G4P5_9STRA|nr:hypothetical protein PR001_g33356 [Phytophthora rubi]
MVFLKHARAEVDQLKKEVKRLRALEEHNTKELESYRAAVDAHTELGDRLAPRHPRQKYPRLRLLSESRPRPKFVETTWKMRFRLPLKKLFRWNLGRHRLKLRRRLSLFCRIVVSHR